MTKMTDCKELALKKIKITGNVVGKFGTFEIEQKFVNNTKKTLEVGYTFPIVESATVTGFEILVGDKLLKGVCKETKSAKKEYLKNLLKGNSAYLLEEKSDNVFAITIGKIAKNEEVTVKIRFIDKFDIIDNKIQILIPTLVPPKYNCEITDKLQYGKVDYDVDFNINVLKSINFESINSATHKFCLIDKKNATTVQILNYDMSKDFKLEIALKEELVSKGILKTNSDNEDIVYLSFMPEINDCYEDSEKEYLFLIDISGSMFGKKLGQTKNAVIQCLKQLDFGDRFNIVAFESEFEAMSRVSLEYNEQNLEKAYNYINSLDSCGGTEIFEPIRFALEYNDDEKVILLFTDGEVGNEEEIIDYIEENIGQSRIFPFGIDTSVNTYFINNVARYGNGKAEFIAPEERIDDKVIRTFARIQTPLLENVEIDCCGNILLDEIRESNALFNYELYNAFVKIAKLEDDIVLKGNILDKEYCWRIKKDDIITSDIDLDLLFVKEEIDRLENRIRNTEDKDDIQTYKEMIIELSEKYNVNSKYTSFLTVNERENKIFEAPKYQETILSAEELANMNMPRMHYCFDCFSNECCDEVFCDDEDFPEHIIEKTDYEKLCDQLNEIYSSVKSMLTKLLYAYWFILEEREDFDFDEFIEYVKQHQEEINQDEDCSGVLMLCYRATLDERIYELLTDVDKRFAKTSARINISVTNMDYCHLEKFVKEECYKDYTNIGLWFVCNNEDED